MTILKKTETQMVGFVRPEDLLRRMAVETHGSTVTLDMRVAPQ